MAIIKSLTEQQIEIINFFGLKQIHNALCGCTFLPGSYEKRFVASISVNSIKPLTHKQVYYLYRLFWSYRKQHKLIPTENEYNQLVIEAKSAQNDLFSNH